MRYQVNAVDARRQVVSLDLTAQSESGAADAARQLGLTILSVRALRFANPFAASRGSSGFPTLLFSIELESLLEAGLNLVEALQALSEKEARGERQAVLSGMLGAISRGESFSQAASRFPQHFSSLYVATLRASERTGNVREALARYIGYEEALDRVRKKALAASIYPAILTIVGLLVLAFLIFYVVPRFARVYEDFNGSLPLFSAALLSIGSAISRYGVSIAVTLAGAAGALAWAVSRAPVRAWLARCLWRVPGVGERMKVYQLARFYRTVGMLLRAGIPVMQVLTMVGEMLALHLRPQLKRAQQLIGEGHAMSAAFGVAGLATPVAARMLLVGERSGQMGEMMEQIARFHDEEIARFVDWFMRAFEPVLMAVLGAAIGLVVVLMYMPIFELAGSIR